VGGYNLDTLVPDRERNLARLLVGSEGTLAFSTALSLKLAPIKPRKVLGICQFATFRAAMEAARHLVTLRPEAVELVDATMIALGRSIPIYRNTIEKILTRYPDLKSIRDFGSVIGNPWKDRFFTLLGKQQSLDGIEHDTLRAPGVFDDPRVHVAVNCASIGCPLLDNRALSPERLDAQLDDLFVRFMADRSRNRYNAQTRTAELSRIFDWYGKDFEKGHRGYSSVNDVVGKHADQLADAPGDRAQLRSGQTPIRFLEYDWSLNDVR